jgi:hypothetical protein
LESSTQLCRQVVRCTGCSGHPPIGQSDNMQFILLPLMAVAVHAEVDWSSSFGRQLQQGELQPEVVSHLPVNYRKWPETVPGLTVSALAGFLICRCMLPVRSAASGQAPFSTPWTHQVRAPGTPGLAANLNGQGVDYVPDNIFGTVLDCSRGPTQTPCTRVCMTLHTHVVQIDWLYVESQTPSLQSSAVAAWTGCRSYQLN